MTTPVILVEDFARRTDLTGHGVTITSEAAGKPKERLADLKDYLAWMPSTTANQNYRVDLGAANDLEPDALAIINHNMGDEGVDWRLQYSDDDAAYSNAISIQSPADNNIIFRKLPGTAGAHRYWRVQFQDVTTDLQVHEIFLGRLIEFPFGIDPFNNWQPLAQRPRNRMFQSEEGFILETLADYVGRRPTWQFNALPWTSFVNDTTAYTGFRWWWNNYALLGKPGVFHWNPGNPGDFETDALFGVPLDLNGDRLATSVDRGFRNVAFAIAGRNDG